MDVTWGGGGETSADCPGLREGGSITGGGGGGGA